MAPLKAIVESESYTAARRAMGVDCKRLDEILEAVVLELSAAPEFFPRTPYTDLRTVKTTSFSSDVDEYLILFRIEKHQVVLEYISVADTHDPPTGHPKNVPRPVEEDDVEFT
jgi:hypothetical protein